MYYKMYWGWWTGFCIELCHYVLDFASGLYICIGWEWIELASQIDRDQQDHTEYGVHRNLSKGKTMVKNQPQRSWTTLFSCLFTTPLLITTSRYLEMKEPKDIVQTKLTDPNSIYIHSTNCIYIYITCQKKEPLAPVSSMCFNKRRFYIPVGSQSSRYGNRAAPAWCDHPPSLG